MKLNQLSIEELVELRTQMVLEKKSTTQINRVIDEKEREYVTSLLEDSSTGGPAGAVGGGDIGGGGVAFGNNSIAGMGNVVAAQPSSLPGSTIGSAWSDNGGTTGSGDVSFPLPGPGKMYQKTQMGKSHGARTGKKSREKKLDLKQLKNAFARKQDYTSGEGQPKPKRVMSFDDFQKDSMSKVTKVKESKEEDKNVWHFRVKTEAKTRLSSDLVDLVLNSTKDEETINFYKEFTKKGIQDYPGGVGNWQIAKSQEVRDIWDDSISYDQSGNTIKATVEFDIDFPVEFDKDDVINWCEGFSKIGQSYWLNKGERIVKGKLVLEEEENKNEIKLFINDLIRNQKFDVELISGVKENLYGKKKFFPIKK